MRKILFFIVFFANISILNAQMRDPYYIDAIDRHYFGIYLPVEYITAIELTKSHSFSLGLNRERSYHDIIIVMDHIIYSDYAFADQYAIPSNEIKEYEFFVNSGYETIIRDNNGTLYKKISDNTDNYCRVVSYYIGKIILRDLNTKRLGLVISGNNVFIPFINNNVYEIILYEKGVYVGSNLVLKNKNNNEWIYLVIENKKYTFYHARISGLQILRTNKIIYEIEI
jgi:hypothetical protein